MNLSIIFYMGELTVPKEIVVHSTTMICDVKSTEITTKHCLSC